MISSLFYSTTSRHKICSSVGEISYLSTVKFIICFVNGTINGEIWYSKDTNSSLARYSDTNWASNFNERKSTTASCFYLKNNLVSWHSKKQNSISLSTTEGECIAINSCCAHSLVKANA